MNNESISFVADVHLGRLARWLRLLGFDAAYQNCFTKKDLIYLAQQENRVLLSRDGSIKNKAALFQCFYISSADPFQQVMEVLDTFQLKEKVKPFTRCMKCNGLLLPVEKEKVQDQLPENTRRYYHEFWQCNKCHQVYWKGAHYQRMQMVLGRIRNA